MMKQATVGTVKPSIVARLKGFYQETKGEMSKVAWPTKEELKASTWVVLFLLGILAAVVGIYDAVFQFVVLVVLRFLG